MTDPTFGAALSRLWPTAPAALREGIVATEAAVFAKYGFGPLEQSHFMAQISHECGAGRALVENLNYSPEGIVRTWPKRFASISEAMPFAHKPQALANKVYSGRMGNRPGSNDGWSFRGRGGTNTTGHDGYYRLAVKMAVDLLSNPELVNDPQIFLECAVVDFILCGCLPFARRDDLRGVTYHLNGGLIGLAQREAWLKRWKVALVGIHGVDAVYPETAPRPAGQLQYGDKSFEVKGLQAALKDKGYGVGADDGEFHETTRGAVAKLQLDHGLPATGVVDQDTKDALSRSEGAPIGENRATATVQDLREAGSRTVQSADRLGLLGKLKAFFGFGAAGGAIAEKVGAFDLDTVQSGVDKAQQAASMFDQVKPWLAPIFNHPAMLPAALLLGIAGVAVWLEARRIRNIRLDDHRSAANMGR